MEFWRQLYLGDSLFEVPELPDSFVYDMIRKTFEGKLADFTSYDIAEKDTPSDHPFINSVLGGYMDHLKGDDRKQMGKSPEDDLMIKRDEEYWREG